MQSDSIGGNQRQSRCTQSPSEAVSLPITSTHLHDGVGQVHVGHSARKGSRGVTVSDVGNELEPKLSRVERSMEGRAHLMREAIMCNQVQSGAIMCNHVQSEAPRAQHARSMEGRAHRYLLHRAFDHEARLEDLREQPRQHPAPRAGCREEEAVGRCMQAG